MSDPPFERVRLDYARAALEVGHMLCSGGTPDPRPELVTLALVNVRAAVRCLLPYEKSCAGLPVLETPTREALERASDAGFADREQARLDLDLLLACGATLLRARERPLRQARATRRKAAARRLVPFVGLAVLVTWLGHWLLSPHVISKGKPWKTSSVAWPCDPVHRSCGGVSTKILFHTLSEPSPWFEIDLGKPYAVTGLSVENRSDCCAERALPLVAETSLDHARYDIVAHRYSEFDRWEPHFPSVRARYVRLRVTRESLLHLEQVRVYGDALE